MQNVIITIGADAEVTVEAANVKGQGCQALTQAIEQSLGTTTSDVKKPEYHQRQEQHAGNAQHRR